MTVAALRHPRLALADGTPALADRPAPERRRRRPRMNPTVATKIAALVLVFLAVPAILYGVFREADGQKNALLLLGAREQGRLIAQGLKPHLAAAPGPTAELTEALARFSTDGLSVKVLFRPAASGADFFYIAVDPPLSATLLDEERERLLQLGILDGLAASCALELPSALRHRRAGGHEELITSITPIRDETGCWAVVTASTTGPLAESSLGRPYWTTPEVRAAAAIYLAMAAFVISMFLRVARGLSRFGRVAAEIRAGRRAGSFSAQNRMPELAGVAGEIDRMVETLRKLSHVVENSPAAVIVTDPKGRIEYVNPALTALTGYTEAELVGRSWRKLRSPETPLADCRELLRGIARGETWRGELCSRARTGEPRWALVSVAASPGPDGRAAHLVAVLDDITERKRAERRARLLMAELNHRVKNALATVKSVAMQTLNQATTLEQFRHAFEGRLAVLAQTHDLLTRGNWEGADLRATVERALGPYGQPGTSSVRIAGPPVRLSPKLALALALALHELATNAAKYGALTAPGGRVTIAWSLENAPGGQRLRLDWSEAGGPQVAPPSRPGFGSRLIESGLAYDLDGEASLEFRPEGVRCTMALPWPGTDTGCAAAALA